MDKNFISIDDLVRQRLEGEEERDRPAGWLQMRDLLDKEMPQVRGGFYWRRMFGAVGLILLATSISVGGYMFASSIKADNAGTASSQANNRTTATPIAANSTSTTLTKDNKTEIVNANEVKDTKQLVTNTHASSVVAANHNDMANGTTAAVRNDKAKQLKHNETVATPTKILASNTIAKTTNTTENTNKVNSTNIPDTRAGATVVNAEAVKSNEKLPSAVAHKKNENKDDVKKSFADKTTSVVSVTNTPKTVHEKTVAAHQPGTHSKNAGSSKDDAKKKQFLSQLMATNEEHKKAAKMHEDAANTELLASSSNAIHKHVKGMKSSPVVTTGNHTVTDETPAVTKVSKTTGRHHALKADVVKTGNAVAMNTIATAHPVKESHKAVVEKKETINTQKLALGSGTPAVKKIAKVSAAPAIDAADQSIAGNASKSGAAKNNVTPAGSLTNTTNGSNNTIRVSNNKMKPVTGSTDIKEVAVAKLEQRTIDRVMITEHYIRTAPHDGYYLLDTISIDKLTMDLANNDPRHTNGARRVPGSKEDEENSSGNSSAARSANSAILPGAATSSNGKSGLAKQNQSLKGSGTTTVEKLNATFNDVKFHVAGAQFAAGLTGGINGTFFGPNSFKGFQFGFTGTVTFSESIGIMAELKYFHRINNDYTLNDNYYTYTPTGGGLWSKQLSANSYSFSTLHSVELPVTIRYTKSHFCFYAGGNFVYSFAINSGEAIQPNNTAPVLVSSVGNDNTPKLHPDDFNSKFGIGYAVGLSYEVYPNLTLDFRNVQTVWDNSGSQGAKMISNQLYRSPSFQVSLGYRLGGNKKRN